MERSARDDERSLANGLDPCTQNPAQLMALMRLLHDCAEEVKRAKRIDPLIHCLNRQMKRTAKLLEDVPVAYRKGCSFCCNLWVDATAPEVLTAFKAIRKSQELVASVRKANKLYSSLTFEQRWGMLTPCPMLADNLCSIYGGRPRVCRTAVSQDADACRRTYLEHSQEGIPTPLAHVVAKTGFAMALAGALKRACLPHVSYEFIGALNKALDTQECERRWLEGEDIFSDVQRSPVDVLTAPQNLKLYHAAFRQALAVDAATDAATRGPQNVESQ
jgi:hypothetical protein